MDEEQPAKPCTYHLAHDRTGRQHQAICSCGWRTDWVPSAGLAGASWDAHAQQHRDEHRTEPHWVMASTPVEGGYQTACACGWRSSVSPEPLRLVDEWSVHAGAAGPDAGRSAPD